MNVVDGDLQSKHQFSAIIYVAVVWFSHASILMNNILMKQRVAEFARVCNH